MTETCNLCNGLRGHARLQDDFTQLFREEYEQATQEYEQLKALYQNVCWYNFETRCRSWRHPWPTSFPISSVHLNSAAAVKKQKRRRYDKAEKSKCYYSGAVKDAPFLPPQIVLRELIHAGEYKEMCKTQLTAATDWAPGGFQYRKLQNTTLVGISSNVIDGGRHEC